jgi:hypothetical protein
VIEGEVWLVEVAYMNRFGPPTAFTLLAVTLFLLHGALNWLSIFRWSPIFTSLTLLASVNIAPRMIRSMTILGAGFSAIMLMGLRSRTEIDREIDLEQTVGLLEEMVELSDAGHERPDDFDFLLGHMDRLPEAEDHEEAEETPDSLELDSGSVSTSLTVRALLRYFNSVPSQVPRETVNSSVGSMPGQNIIFPQTPEDQLSEMPLVRSASSPRTEESSLVHMMPE